MATIAVSPEKLTELKAEATKPEATVNETGPATQEAAKGVAEARTSDADASRGGATGEEDDSDKKLRAVRQSMLNCQLPSQFLFHDNLL
jgi:hypothetical protein